MATNKTTKNYNIMPSEIDLFLDTTNTIKSTQNIKNQVQNAVASRLLDRLWYDPTYGIQIQEKLKRFNFNDFSRLEKLAENEILKDDRIASCTVSIEVTNINDSVNAVAYINVTVVPKGFSDLIQVNLGLPV
jgi:hypothetical protein